MRKLHLRDINNVIINIGAICEDERKNRFIFDWDRESQDWIAIDMKNNKIQMTQEKVMEDKIILIKKI